MKNKIKIAYFDEYQECAERTYSLLHQISSHLSYRAGFQKTEYVVELRKDGVRILSGVPMVYPDPHSRKPESKMNMIEHILKHHENASEVEVVSQREYSFGGFNVVPGVYRYQPSVDRGVRRWVCMV